jgi:hypothetical protein
MGRAVTVKFAQIEDDAAVAAVQATPVVRAAEDTGVPGLSLVSQPTPDAPVERGASA